jgi:predicted negative regulator of RcsB-dependent stress response
MTHIIGIPKFGTITKKFDMEVKMKLGTALVYGGLLAAGFFGGTTYNTHHQNAMAERQPYQQIVKEDVQYDRDKENKREIETGKLFKLYYAVEGVFETKAASKKSTVLEKMLE